MVRTPIELRATCPDIKGIFNCQDRAAYVTQRGVVGVGDDSLEVPKDLSFGEDGAVLTIQYVEPVLG